MKRRVTVFFAAVLFIMIPAMYLGCGYMQNRDSGRVLKAEAVLEKDDEGGEDFQDIPGQAEGIHPMFTGTPGVPVSRNSMGSVDPDPAGYNASTDYDGDGIPNAEEVITNSFVADYPRIVTRIAAPITMEIRVSESSMSENHTEILDDSDMKETITNSMEDRQYAALNTKTTPYVVKESLNESEAHSDTYSYSDSSGISGGFSLFGFGLNAGYNSSRSGNWVVSDSMSRATMSERTVFEHVDYIDNLDRNGVEFTSETVQNISRNYRKSAVLKSTENIGPDAGVVRAALFIRNETVNMPVRISSVVCTLSFRTPAGQFLPVKTFRLRNEDYSDFDQSVYGGEELGPYTVEVENLNTHEVTRALENGYVPQIHVVSYEMHRVEDSNYNPGVDNMKIIEETAKARTAVITVCGKNMRERYRVAAFDVDEDGNLSPGVSLKKALFRIYRRRVGTHEDWNSEPLTVADNRLRWKTGSPEHGFDAELDGNSWEEFETYVKSYVDEYNTEHRIETIKRIGDIEKYNPFNPEDNPSYSPSEPLPEHEIKKMKYWVILHNGRYFNGDVNDPIWAGERYEILCFDVGDFNDHYTAYYYTPLQSREPFLLNTRWNRLSNSEEFSRAVYLGRVVTGDVIHLELDLEETRYLFDQAQGVETVGIPEVSGDTYTWKNFNYTFQPEDETPHGIPADFNHLASGGTNCISVRISPSENAFRYRVSYREAGNEGAEWKHVSVSDEEIERSSMEMVVNRKSTDTTGSGVGPVLGGKYYDVTVTAIGSYYGVDVSKESSSNGTQSTRVFVRDAEPGFAPGAFRYSASGQVNSIDLRIEDSQNTEYYVIRCRGPLNYTHDSDVPEYTVVGKAGYNTIPVGNPGEISDETGVYRIQVVAENSNCIGNGVGSLTGDTYVGVNYDRYADQKRFAPVISRSLHDLRAVDLEVNFNDGEGWYRLKLSNETCADRSIDCRYTSYCEYDRQRFHVFFRPPSGPDDEFFPSLFNIFHGGREEADIYIRTVARNRYRDTLWPVAGAGDDVQVCTGVLDMGFTDFWTGCPATDATLFDDTLEYGNSDFVLSSTGPGNYFFSPMEQRKYRIKAYLRDEPVQAGVSQVDEPLFSAEPGDRCIRLTGIESQYADSFRVFWRRVPEDSAGSCDALVMNEDVMQYPWNSTDLIYAADLISANCSYSIESLTHNLSYIVAVSGCNKYGTWSSPVYYRNSFGQVQPLIPYSTAAPARPETLSVSTGSPVVYNGEERPSIIISNLHVPGERLYQVQWKQDNISEWITGDTVEAADMDPVSFIITGLNYWERYNIRARAITLSGVPGEYSEEFLVQTGNPSGSGFSINPDAEWTLLGWTGIGGDRYELKGNLVFYYDPSRLPAGTVKVSHNGGTDWNNPTGSINVLENIKLAERDDDPEGGDTVYYYTVYTLDINLQCRNRFDEVISLDPVTITNIRWR